MEFQAYKDGALFGPFHRFQAIYHKARPGVESQWLVLDVESPDEITGNPGIVFQGEESGLYEFILCAEQDAQKVNA